MIAALLLLALAAWWFFDLELPEGVPSACAPLAGACIIYWYWSPLAFAIGAALFLLGGYGIYRLLRRRRAP